jgi:hypothetical protein
MDETHTFDRRRSLIELDPEAGQDEDLSRQVHAVLTKPARRLSTGELEFLIGENRSLTYTVPLAIEKLADAPFLEVARYPGDLLTTMLQSDSRFWTERKDLWLEMVEILEEAVNAINAHMESQEEQDAYLPSHVGDEFMAALLHFRGIHP